MKTTYLKTPLGIARIKGDNDGVSEIKIQEKNIDFEESKELPDCVFQAKNQLQDYFLQKRKSFDFKLNPKGTPFQQKVWQALTTIKQGETKSYAWLAEKT